MPSKLLSTSPTRLGLHERPLAAAMLSVFVALGGCRVAEPRFSSPGGSPPLLEAADRMHDSLQQALDNVDYLIENAAY